MKRFVSKKSIQKIVILIVIVLSFNFIMPTYSRADFGGVLMGPVVDFITGLGDAVLSALQFFMYDGTIDVTSVAGGALDGVLTIINPFDSFLLKRSNSEFNAILEKYGINVTQKDLDENKSNSIEGDETKDDTGIDITIDSDKFDKGWFGWLGDWAAKDYGVPVIKYTPEKIFGNQVPALDANFINPKDYSSEPNGTEMNRHSVTITLHNTIASWYVALRNLAIVVLLSVLLYVGIRMVISSSTTDKSKYKEMLFHWLVAICILFFLHYIMSFILSLTNMITEALANTSEIIVDVVGDDPAKFKTDLTGLVRLQVQYKDLGARLIYMIFYIALVIYTVMFTWVYVKRAITMAFLTLMAPVIAITYPIDKIGDGKAQAFGIWFREFVFNALLQPFHLIIYTVFLGAASEIVVKNPIYAILFLAFIIPAEKLLRKMFGFEKSSTAGGMSTALGMFGGAAAFKSLTNIANRKRNSSGKSSATQNKIRTKEQIKDKNEIGKDLSAFAKPAPVSSSAQSTSMRLNSRGNTVAGNTVLQLNSEEPVANSAAIQENQEGSRSMDVGQGMSSSLAQDSIDLGRDSSIRTYEDNTRVSLPRRAIRGVKNTAIGGLRGLGNVAKEGAKYTLNKAKTNFTPRKIANFAGRTAVRGLSAATLGAVGLGIGIAGDDLEDVLKYGAASAALGGTVVGGRLASAGGRVMHGANVAFQEGYHGSKNAATMVQQAREFKADESNIEYFGEEFEVKGKELDKILDRAAEVNNQGITDKKAIKQTLKLENSIKRETLKSLGTEELSDDMADMAKQQAITIAKIADRYDEGKLRTDEKYVQGVYNDFERGIKKANPQIGAHDLETQKETMMKLLRRYKKID